MSMLTMQIMAVKGFPRHDFSASKNAEFVISDPMNDTMLIWNITDVSERYSAQMNTIKTLNPQSVVSNLLSIYKRIEEETASQSYGVCKKGCSNCCADDVAISVIEFFYLVNYIGVNFTAETIKEYSRQAKKPDVIGRCIFIDDANGECKVYAARPIICRKYGVYQANTDCPYILSDEKAKRGLVKSEYAVEENVDFFKINNHKITPKFNTLVYWFSNLNNGEFKSQRMKDLFEAAFTEEVDEFVKIMVL